MALTPETPEAPDLTLLDLMMRGIDGYTVCRTLHAEPITRTIPVVFSPPVPAQT